MGVSPTTDAEIRRRVRRAGYGHVLTLTERQWVDRWNDRPELWDDLLRVLCGTPLASIGNERRTYKEAKERAS